MKLTANLERKYRSAKSGNNVFVYLVSGSADALKAYQEAQGANYRTDENGKPIFFSNKSFGRSGELIITANGNVIFDDTKLVMAGDMIERFSESSPLVAQAMADAFAKQLLGTSDVPVVPTTTPTETPQTDSGLEDL